MSHTKVFYNKVSKAVCSNLVSSVKLAKDLHTRRPPLHTALSSPSPFSLPNGPLISSDDLYWSVPVYPILPPPTVNE